MVERFHKLEANHKDRVKNLELISKTSRVSISKLVIANARRFEHVEGPLRASIGKLPPLRSPLNQSNDGFNQKKIIEGQNSKSRRAKSLVRQKPNKNSLININANNGVNFTFANQESANESAKFNLGQGSKQEKTGLNMNDTSQASNINKSSKRKVKRSFPRPNASSIFGLDKDGPLLMNNTHSTDEHRMEIGKDAGNLISSIDNDASSVEHNAMTPKMSGQNQQNMAFPSSAWTRPVYDN